MKWHRVATAGVLIVAAVHLACAIPAHAQEERSKRGERLRAFLERRRARRAPASHSGSATSSREALTVDGRARTYLVHLPTGYPHSQPAYPVVVVLHGTLGTGEKVSGQTRFSELADREGFVVVYPDAVANWSDGRGTSDAERAGVNDVAFFKALVAELLSRYRLDAKRIYVTGVSSGGIMAYRLGCEAAELFAALAPVIANVAEPLAGRCAPSKAVPLMAINGASDPLVPFEGGICCKTPRGGGEGGAVLSTQGSLAIFARKNGCEATPIRERLPVLVNDGTEVEKRTYPGCESGAEVVSYAIVGGGHAWPPNPPQAPKLAGLSSKNIDATDVIWEFFKNHPKRTHAVP